VKGSALGMVCTVIGYHHQVHEIGKTGGGVGVHGVDDDGAATAATAAKPPEDAVVGFMCPGVNTLDKRGSDVAAARRRKCVPGGTSTRDLAPTMTRDRVLLRKGQSGNGAESGSCSFCRRRHGGGR